MLQLLEKMLPNIIKSYFAPNAQHVAVYSLFSGTYWALWTNTTILLSSIAEGISSVATIVVVFFAIAVILWIVGLSQMITGGWASYE